MLKYWLGIVGLFVWVGCSTSFTPQEVKVIKEGGGIMRVWKTDNREDSLFLRQQAIELTPGEIRTELFQVLKQRMLATVNDSADPGVGIAAPQVGISRRLIAVQRYDKPGAPFEFYINPGIVSASEEQSLGKEGCLSVPDVVLLLMVLGVMLSGFRAADALDHMRKEIIRQEGKRRGWWS